MKTKSAPGNPAAVMTAATVLSAAKDAAVVSRTISMSADEAFEEGMGAFGVQRSSGGGVELYDRNLIEDDGPGIGHHQPGKNSGMDPVKIGGGAGGVRVKKILHVDRPEAFSAKIYVRPGPVVEVNGTRIETDPHNPATEIPVSLLKKGDNEIILTNPGEKEVEVKAAARKDILRNAPERKDRPGRSFISHDDGKTWQATDCEFMVRLHLVQHATEGNFLSPVFDLAKTGEADAAEGTEDADVLAPAATVHSATIKAETFTPAGTQIQFLVRTGPTPVYELASWSEWRRPESELPKGHRYLQWKAILKSSNPSATPIIKRVTVEAKVSRERKPAWADQVTVAASVNPTIVYTSIPFAYENTLHPKMVALREKYHLDDIVAGSKTEWEKFIKLRHWVSRQWKWTPPVVDYPDWDADEILTRKYGFCVQHAITYMQCAISLGYQTRFLFSNNPGNGGHEVCEVWSNEYQKWCYIDSADNFHYVNRATNIPMSMLEIHDLIVKTYFGDQPVSYANQSNDKVPVKELGICYGLELEPTGSAPEWSREKCIDGVYQLSRMWTTIRFMPRNNFYSEPYPAPICQGRHWDWSEYIVWEGEQMPKGQWLYKNFSGRRSDLEWTLNQVRFEAVCDKKPGLIQVRMGTVTPGFETYLVRVDGGVWKGGERAFDWHLHPRKNRLEMRVRTQSGIEGPVSLLELNYDL